MYNISKSLFIELTMKHNIDYNDRIFLCFDYDDIQELYIWMKPHSIDTFLLFKQEIRSWWVYRKSISYHQHHFPETIKDISFFPMGLKISLKVTENVEPGLSSGLKIYFPIKPLPSLSGSKLILRDKLANNCKWWWPVWQKDRCGLTITNSTNPPPF